MPSEVERLARIQRAHHLRLIAIQEATADLVGAAWDRLGGLDDDALRAFSNGAAAVVDAAKVQTTNVAVGYMSANDRIIGEVARLIPIVPQIRGGVPTVDVYARSVVAARVRIANGGTFDEAMATGRARATGTATTDITLVNKATIDNGAAARPWIVGYRRVLTGKSCGFCAMVSTQRYHRANLMPIHQRCDCDVAEIVGSADPGRVVNRQLLRDVKKSDAVARRYTVDSDGTIRTPDGEAINVKVAVQPEVGPVLTAA